MTGWLGLVLLLALVVAALWWADQQIDPDDPDEEDMDKHSW